MTLKIYLYDADGRDREIELAPEILRSLDERSLLWIDVDEPADSELEKVAELLGIERRCLEADAAKTRPTLDNYGDYFRFSVDTAPLHHDPRTNHNSPDPAAEAPKSVRVNFVVGEQWLLTLHCGPVHFLDAFREQDKAETMIGLLSPPALAASLLDWHLAGYFAEMSRVEEAVDRLDERVLRETTTRSLLGRMVALRRRVSKLRALLVGHRDIFYGLARPDLVPSTDPGADPFFHALPGRFERAEDEIERTRDIVTGSFDLFTSRSSQNTNDLVKILTFVTAIIGFCAAVAGLLGMNFQLSFFATGYEGFAIVTGGLALIAVASIAFARHRGWI